MKHLILLVFCALCFSVSSGYRKRRQIHGHDNLNNVETPPEETGMPNFFADVQDLTDTSFSFVLTWDRAFRNASHYEVVVLKLNKDINDLPRLAKPDPGSFTEIGSFADEPHEGKPYIAGRFTSSNLPYVFTVGDRKHYNGFYNGPLEPSSFYAIFLRGTVQMNFVTSHLASDYISDRKLKGIPEFFHTLQHKNQAVVQLSVILGIVAVLATVLFIMMVCNVGVFGRLRQNAKQKKRKRKRYVKLEEGGSDSDSDVEIAKSKSEAKRRERRKHKSRVKASQQKAKTKASKIVKKPTKLETIAETVEGSTVSSASGRTRKSIPAISVTEHLLSPDSAKVSPRRGRKRGSKRKEQVSQYLSKPEIKRWPEK